MVNDIHPGEGEPSGIYSSDLFSSVNWGLHSYADCISLSWVSYPWCICLISGTTSVLSRMRTFAMGLVSVLLACSIIGSGCY